MYVRKLRNNSGAYRRYFDIIRNNPEYYTAIVMACRNAKEILFSNRGEAGFDSVYIQALEREEVYMSEIEELINTQEVYPVLRDNFNISDATISYMRGKSWRRLFQEFLQDMKLGSVYRKNEEYADTIAERVAEILLHEHNRYKLHMQERYPGLLLESRT